MDKEQDKKTRWIKEAIWIKTRDTNMNRDGGMYMLSHLYDPLIKTIPGPEKTTSGKTTTSGQVSRSKENGSIPLKL